MRHRSFGVLVHYKAVIAVHSHFGNVHAFNFDSFGRTMRAAAEHFDDLVGDEAQDGDDDEATDHTNRLRKELAKATTVEQADNFAGSAVPTFAVFAVSEQAEGQTAPRAVDAVDADRADRIVNATLVPEEHAFDNEDAGHDADDAGADGIHERARCGDGHQTGEHAIANHRRIGFLGFEPPHIKRRRHRSRCKI